MIPIAIKPGVKLIGMVPQMSVALATAAAVYSKYQSDPLWITAVTDGIHKRSSAHNTGRAVDLRIWTLPEDKYSTVVAEIKSFLGEDFDVLLEKDHIHIEFDPK